jgi:GT2 family glycosyltransferase
MKRAVSIVIPNWNGLNLLQQFLPSVVAAASRYCATGGAPVEILVVDDASTDDSVNYLREHDFLALRAEETGRVAENASECAVARRLLRNDENRGFSATANAGVAAARHPLVFLINNDVELSEDCIAPLAAHFEDPSVFAVHCRVIDPRTGEECGVGQMGGFARGFLRVHQSWIPRPAAAKPLDDADAERAAKKPYSMFASGGSAMFDREKWLALGGFEPLLAPAYWEDVELSYRAWKRGFTICYEPQSVVRHPVSSTMGRLDPRKIRRMRQRNRLIAHWIHLQDAGFLASHVLWVGLLALLSPLGDRGDFLAALISARRSLPAIRRRRAEELAAAKRSDRQVLAIFAELRRRPDVLVFNNKSERARAEQKTSPKAR